MTLARHPVGSVGVLLELGHVTIGYLPGVIGAMRCCNFVVTLAEGARVLARREYLHEMLGYFIRLGGLHFSCCDYR